MNEAQLIRNLVAFVAAAISAPNETEQALALEGVRSHLNVYVTTAVKAAVASVLADRDK